MTSLKLVSDTLVSEPEWPPIPDALIEMLDKTFPPLEFTFDASQANWVFNGGQRAVVAKLKSVADYQRNRET